MVEFQKTEASLLIITRKERLRKNVLVNTDPVIFKSCEIKSGSEKVHGSQINKCHCTGARKIWQSRPEPEARYKPIHGSEPCAKLNS